jgi:hypothetical protein
MAYNAIHSAFGYSIMPPKKVLAIIFALLIVPFGNDLHSQESDTSWWLPKLKSGEDALVANRNAVLNKMAEHFDKRLTIVKFDDDLETKCPVLTSLFSSTGSRLSWLTPNYSLYDARAYVDGRGADKASASLVVENADCRYVLTVRRYEREEGEEKIVSVGEIPEVGRERFVPRSVKAGDEKFGFDEVAMRYANSSHALNFTGLAFFAPTTFTINLANVEKDISISSESNFLSHSYTVEIKNPQAALRISIRKELYSNGQWANAYAK